MHEENDTHFPLMTLIYNILLGQIIVHPLLSYSLEPLQSKLLSGYKL